MPYFHKFTFISNLLWRNISLYIHLNMILIMFNIMIHLYVIIRIYDDIILVMQKFIKWFILLHVRFNIIRYLLFIIKT